MKFNMKWIVTITIIIFSVLLFSSCKKLDNTESNSFTNIEVPENFNWSSGALIIDTINFKDNIRRYPDEGYYYQIYEDMWPSIGDYDFNDLIIKSYVLYNISRKDGTVYSKVIRSDGGLTPHSFGVQLLEYKNDAMWYDKSIILSSNSNIPFTIYDNQNLICFNNIKTNDSIIFNFHLHNNFSVIIQPFLSIGITFQKEIHIYGYPPSDLANINYFDTYNDVSSINRIYTEKYNGYWNLNYPFYNTYKYYPWGMELISDTFYIPIEKTDISIAYPQFKEWVESNRTVNNEWFKYPDFNNVY